jgi:hypothetical protein
VANGQGLDRREAAPDDPEVERGDGRAGERRRTRRVALGERAGQHDRPAEGERQMGDRRRRHKSSGRRSRGSKRVPAAAEHDIELRLGRTAVDINASLREVALDDGEQLRDDSPPSGPSANAKASALS